MQIILSVRFTFLQNNVVDKHHFFECRIFGQAGVLKEEF